MTIEVTRYDDKSGGTHVRITVCPLCGHEFQPREKRSEHIFQNHDVNDVPALTENGGGVRAD